MLSTRKMILVCCIFASCVISYASRDEYVPPRLTVVIVIDAFAYDYLLELVPYMRGGIKTLLDQGVVYTNAYWPHGTVATGPGHTGLSTGVFACDHGIVGNAWFADDMVKKIAADYDPSSDAWVYSADGFYHEGCSPCNIMVDTISDNFMMQAQPEAGCQVYSFSHKSRAAIATAGRLGKAFWLDENTGLFTSSKAYYKKGLPPWLIRFNKESGISKLNKISWKLCYPGLPYKYNFENVNNYQFAAFPESIIGKEFQINHGKQHAYNEYFMLPESNQAVFDVAMCCLRENLSRNRCDRMIMWVCPSQLDKVGHLFGPYSKEAIDSVYHLDLQIRKFMHDIGKLVKGRDFTVVLTADHGITPIAELIKDKGYNRIWRLDEEEINKKLTNIIKEEFNLDIIARVRDFNIWFSKAFDALSADKQEVILQRLKRELLTIPAIKMVWTDKELDALNPEPDQIEYFIKKQRFAGRCGKLFLQLSPFCQLTKHDKGTSHEVPGELDQHVPLVIYRKHVFEKRTVNTKVWMLQFANSLAAILRVPKPSLSTFAMLPGIFSKEEIFI